MIGAAEAPEGIDHSRSNRGRGSVPDTYTLRMAPPDPSPDVAMMSLGLMLALLGGIAFLLCLLLIALIRMRRSKVNPHRRASRPRSPLDPWHEGGRRRANQTPAMGSEDDFSEAEDEDA